MRINEEQKTIDSIFHEILAIEYNENYKMIDLLTKEIIQEIEKKILNGEDSTTRNYLQAQRIEVIHTLDKEVQWVSHPKGRISKKEHKRRYQLAKDQLSVDLIGLFGEK